MSKHTDRVSRARNALNIAAKQVFEIDRQATKDVTPAADGMIPDDPLVYFRKAVAETCLGFLEGVEFGLHKLAEVEALRDAGDPQATIEARDYMLALGAREAASIGIKSPYERPPGKMH